MEDRKAVTERSFSADAYREVKFLIYRKPSGTAIATAF